MSTPTTEDSSSDVSDNSKRISINRRWQVLVVLPYFVGIAWACLHPVASILTGDFSKPRNFYVDESSLESSYLRSTFEYLAPKTSLLPHVSEGALLCDSVTSLLHEQRNVECYRHRPATPTGYKSNTKQQSSEFDLLRLVPTGTTMEPSNEAIALIAPFSATSHQMHAALLELMQRLASPVHSPWLAKTILLVAPTSPDQSLEDVTHAFLESYAGQYDSSSTSSTTKPHNNNRLPLHFTDAMIRNLIVLDSQASEDASQPKHEIRILSQGEHGVLPNMDLVFVSMTVFSREPGRGSIRRSNSDSHTLFMHPYGKEKQQWELYIKTMVETHFQDNSKRSWSRSVERWAVQMGNLVLFCRNLLSGPYAPHALALNRGIDAITIQGRYLEIDTIEKAKKDIETTTITASANARSFVAKYVQKLEVTIRALSNLHERLHHSTTLYLLPSPITFVKHEEYLVPNLLLLVPAVLRAALLGLRDIKRFNLAVMGWLLFLTFVATICMDVFVAHLEPTQRNTWWVVLCAACMLVFYDKAVLKGQQKTDDRSTARPNDDDIVSTLQSCQLIACLLTIYVHVPICFGHVALSYPSALFWAPWVAMPSFSALHQSKLRIPIAVAFLMLSWPPAGLLKAVFADVCTPYIRFVFFPLHLVLLLAVMPAVASSSATTSSVKRI